MLIQNLLRQAKDADKLFNEEDIKEKDHVILAMKEMWDKQRERERRIEGTLNVLQRFFAILGRDPRAFQIGQISGVNP